MASILITEWLTAEQKHWRFPMDNQPIEIDLDVFEREIFAQARIDVPW